MLVQMQTPMLMQMLMLKPMLILMKLSHYLYILNDEGSNIFK
jgi:hypothetical protein